MGIQSYTRGVSIAGDIGGLVSVTRHPFNMKKTFLVILAITICILWFVFGQKRILSVEETFATLQDAASAGLIENKWLPDFLPGTVRELRIKRTPDAVIATFSFNSASDLKEMIQRAEKLTTDVVRASRPQHVRESGPWFPAAILKGDVDELTRSGWEFYRISQQTTIGSRSVIEFWHFGINNDDKVGYLWYEEENTVILPPEKAVSHIEPTTSKAK